MIHVNNEGWTKLSEEVLFQEEERFGGNTVCKDCHRRECDPTEKLTDDCGLSTREEKGIE